MAGMFRDPSPADRRVDTSQLFKLAEKYSVVRSDLEELAGMGIPLLTTGERHRVPIEGGWLIHQAIEIDASQGPKTTSLYWYPSLESAMAEYFLLATNLEGTTPPLEKLLQRCKKNESENLRISTLSLTEPGQIVASNQITIAAAESNIGLEILRVHQIPAAGS